MSDASPTAAPVLCLVEHGEDGPLEASRRALSFARSLASTSDSPLAAVLVGRVSAAIEEALAAFGVARAFWVTTSQLDAYAPVAWARALVELTGITEAHAVVAGGTDRGNEVMAHVGALTGLPMVANCFTASRSNGAVKLSRQRWAGSLIEDSVLETSTALLTVAFDGVASEPAAAPAGLTSHEFHPTIDDADLVVHVTEWMKRPGGVSLADARVVVGGGRGVGSAEGFAAIVELAELLGGAVGVSRAVTSLGWRSHSEQVGQTGTRIAPDLYIASGISGATQHLAGCQSAKVVLAINTDADAPIITRADYAVIGDLTTIVPALVAAIRARP
ncbi:MAG: electron transfer flavoprotein subunit alpha/FixB family protein [Acidimicrobiales bacterium]